jgi:type IV secretion system protein VirB11
LDDYTNRGNGGNGKGGHTAVISDGSSVKYLLQVFHKYLSDPEITEICVNRPGEVWCERKSKWETHSAADMTFETCMSLSVAIAAFTKTNLSDMMPIMSATLPDGERIQVAIPPAAERGTISITIRKPSKSIIETATFQAQGFFSRVTPVCEGFTDEERELQKMLRAKEYRDFLLTAVRLKKNIVIAGETGSGKTTFMKALMQEVPTIERIITIEDVPELFLPNHPNRVHMFYPSEAADDAPVTSQKLLKSCLRMKPDRIMLAELRGGETFDFINVAASGHGGSITSCHAGSAELTFERLALMVLMNRQGRTLPYEIIRRLLYLVIDIVVHIHNDTSGGKGRHITEIWFDPMKKREVDKKKSS